MTSKTAQITHVKVSLCSAALALSPVLMASTYVFGDAAAAATSDPRPSARGLNMLSTVETEGERVKSGQMLLRLRFNICGATAATYSPRSLRTSGFLAPPLPEAPPPIAAPPPAPAAALPPVWFSGATVATPAPPPLDDSLM